MNKNIELLQLLNTAIIKSREKMIDSSYEERLKAICDSKAIEAINRSITYLSDTYKMTRDQSAMEIIETIRELDTIWNDYVMMEGIDRLKDLLNKKKKTQSSTFNNKSPF